METDTMITDHPAVKPMTTVALEAAP